MKSMFTPGVGMKYIDEQVPLQTNGDGFDLIGSVADASETDGDARMDRSARGRGPSACKRP